MFITQSSRPIRCQQVFQFEKKKKKNNSKSLRFIEYLIFLNLFLYNKTYAKEFLGFFNQNSATIILNLEWLSRHSKLQAQKRAPEIDCDICNTVHSCTVSTFQTRLTTLPGRAIYAKLSGVEIDTHQSCRPEHVQRELTRPEWGLKQFVQTLADSCIRQPKKRPRQKILRLSINYDAFRHFIGARLAVDWKNKKALVSTS
jgi:hypothetical protein